ncbi:MAG: membrane dipeptidase [Polyangiaceae bacterium]
MHLSPAARLPGLLGGLLAPILVLSCAGHTDPKVPPTPPPLPPEPAWACGGAELPEGFTASETLVKPVRCAAARSDVPRFERGEIAAVGGDYWHVATPDGPEGACWMCTGRAPTGEIRSPWEPRRARYLSFLVRRNKGPGTSVLLFEEGRDEPVRELDPAVGGSRFEQVVWDLGEIAGESAPRIQIVIQDDDPADEIEVSDFVVSGAPPEPALPEDPRDRLWGFADLHAHFFTPMAFGGQLFHGDIHSSITPQGYTGKDERSDPRTALRACNDVHGTAPDGRGVLMTLPPEMGHNRNGYPGFEGHPSFRSVYHQQAYVDWLRRAWQGGLRLVQADAVSYPFIEKVYRVSRQHDPGVPANPSDDDWNLVEQTKAAHDFARLPDVKDFVGVAGTPEEARSLVRRGKLAMVLGAELETFGRLDTGIPLLAGEQVIRMVLQMRLGCMREQGIRHVIPIHLGENAFGAPAAYDVLFDLGSSGQRGQHFPMRSADPGEGIFYNREADFREQGDAIKFLVALRIENVSAPPPTPPGRSGEAHAAGLSPAGLILIEEMMRAGMIVDVEHMSALAQHQTLTLAERWAYPVIASHTGFREVSLGPGEASKPSSWPSEREKNDAELARIAALGGLVGVSTGRGPTRAVDGVPACDGGSPGFVANLRHAISGMKGRGVALGTDINGLGGQMAPRFGPWACWEAGEDAARVSGLRGQRGAQNSGVAYSETTPLRRHGTDRFNAAGKSKTVDGREMYLTERERRAWQSVARVLAGDGEKIDVQGDRDPSTVRKYARGFWLFREGKSLTGADARDREISAGYWGCFGAAEACTGRPAPGLTAPQLTGDRALEVRTLSTVWRSWTRMGGPNTPLARSTLGGSDFDFNIDGLAHYGMLPDMLQDVKNLGVTEEELAVLFRSADDFVSMWERAVAASARVRASLGLSLCDTSPERCSCRGEAESGMLP